MKKVSQKEYELMRKRNVLNGDEKIYGLEDWLIDQQDPDNWLVIPEFNVAPLSVAFQGFAFSIVDPGMENFETADSIRYMLTAARMKIRTIFSTRKELMQQLSEAYDRDFNACSTTQQLAFTYFHFERALEDAVKAHQLQADAAAQDIHDMNTGLAVARKVLNRLIDMVDETDDPRDLKVVVEANRAAIDTIRKIRSLDAEAPAAHATVSIDVSDGFAELRAAFEKRLGKSVSG
ncbi:hypothetical protein H3H36_13315 [Duganella sp. FT3S]|uniref:Uncharacterized protein n=1 Tax=Rugamonas fusca TaxID=2758568 RepID=A0A7W2EI25_9BURK|nr:hypothetical protein [Rugamonas fusca]MBA5606330.1 hypothetical protein [Rugamonas fusca]